MIRRIGSTMIFLFILLAVCMIWATPARGQGIFADGFECKVNCGGGPPPALCFDGNTYIHPAGWQKRTKVWQQTFSSPDGVPKATYPNSVSFPVPVPGLIATKGQYLVMPFIPTPALVVNMFWDPAQARPQDGYGRARPALGMFVGISKCQADFRPHTFVGALFDPFLHNGCRKFENTASIFYTTLSAAESDDSVCALEPGETYYLNVIPFHTGLSPPLTGVDTCADSAPNGCDVQMIHRPQ